MSLSSINNEQRLYVMACGDGVSCYGFDVLDRKARIVEWWIESQTDSDDERRAVRLWLDHMPAIGTADHFAACDSMLKRGADFNTRTGKRCPAELVQELIGLEDRRVECEYFGRAHPVLCRQVYGMDAGTFAAEIFQEFGRRVAFRKSR